jgi:hypothetical protein
MNPDSLCLVDKNAAKSLALASALFPGEEWVLKEANIWVAESRLQEEYREKDKWEREMSQVRILTSRGSVAYFLPEKKNEDKGKIYADAVINGEVTELKTVSGNRSTLGSDFRQGYKQGAALVKGRIDIEKHSVYIRLLSDISPGSVKAKIAGDSMVEAHICDGDIAIFHPGLTEGSGIFVVPIGNTLVVKRVDRDPASRTIVLYSANSACEPRRFSGPEAEGIRMAGRVVACYHRV